MSLDALFARDDCVSCTSSPVCSCDTSSGQICVLINRCSSFAFHRSSVAHPWPQVLHRMQSLWVPTTRQQLRHPSLWWRRQQGCVGRRSRRHPHFPRHRYRSLVFLSSQQSSSQEGDCCPRGQARCPCCGGRCSQQTRSYGENKFHPSIPFQHRSRVLYLVEYNYWSRPRIPNPLSFWSQKLCSI